MDKRLGSGADGSANVKAHQFFSSLDWEKLESKQIDPPFKPKVKSETDTSQIDTTFTQERPQDSLVENSLSETMARENNFVGFTYVAPNAMEDAE